MTEDLAITMLSQMLWLVIKVTAPVLGLTLLVGLVVSIFQVVTQLQEMSLTFIPKLLVSGLALIAFGGWIIQQMAAFATRLIGGIPQMLHGF
ncbi:flagellar biosynthetic protein FliQ [Microbulbifer sp. SAOS-129_SWC]|uniref:flagellar biosynthetic protein FliQ n=1 Tax=Microbulbifer sp. SAOS-129_SWC TaxID=3145235 RepID=UPI003216E5FD